MPDPINKIKTLIRRIIFPISKSIQFLYITRFKYCQKLDFEADPINKIKPLIIKPSLFDFKIPNITRLKYCQKLDFEADPINKFEAH